MSKPRRSSGSWRERQERDPYVVRARSEGWRSRGLVGGTVRLAERPTPTLT